MIYAQVGETVTLKPPEGMPLKKYVYWYFDRVDGLQLAWRNTMGGKDISKGEQSITDNNTFLPSTNKTNIGIFVSNNNLILALQLIPGKTGCPCLTPHWSSKTSNKKTLGLFFLNSLVTLPPLHINYSNSMVRVRII